MAALAKVMLSFVLLIVSSVQGCSWCFLKYPVPLNNNPLPVEEYIRQFGYPAESHEIQTKDGYLLTYHRIPHGKNPTMQRGRPVLVQHGLLSSSGCWVLTENSLGFTLADAGFDVWLSNSRGNTYSRKHVKCNPDKNKKFWDFSWHEIGYYDIPASIDYILLQTGQEKLLFIGHSMGSTAYFVMGATRPEYMEKVQTAVVMAPVVFPWHVREKVDMFLSRITEALRIVVKESGTYEVISHSNADKWLDKNICYKPPLGVICLDIISALYYEYKNGLQRVDLEKVLSYYPAGASFKQFDHDQQISQEGHAFQQFDYGYIQNLVKYGSKQPPEYNLHMANTPVYIYHSSNDMKADRKDVLHLTGELPNVKKVIEVKNSNFNHLDFMWALVAKQVYDDIVSKLNNV